MNERIIWQPESIYQPGRDFNITLDSKFAEEMLASKISFERQKAMLDMGNDFLRRNSFNCVDSYTFHEDTALVTLFHLGSEGRWLSLERNLGIMPSHGERYIYHSHNVDSSSNAYALMALVDLWISYAGVLTKE